MWVWFPLPKLMTPLVWLGSKMDHLTLISEEDSNLAPYGMADSSWSIHVGNYMYRERYNCHHSTMYTPLPRSE